MKLEGDYLFDAAIEDVWAALFDPVVLAAVLPGCEKLELVEGKLLGEMKIKVGPVQGKFAGTVELLDQQRPQSYRMVVDGRGAPGFVKANATVKLESEGTGTRMRYDADAQVGGKLASVGQRLVEASARAVVAESLAGLQTNIKLHAAAVAAAAPPSGSTGGGSSSSGSPSGTPSGGAPSSSGSPPSAAPSSATADAPLAAGTPTPAGFTPVKVSQSALARSVAKEVASTMFPRSVLVGIIVLQAAVIAWLLIR